MIKNVVSASHPASRAITLRPAIRPVGAYLFASSRSSSSLSAKGYEPKSESSHIRSSSLMKASASMPRRGVSSTSISRAEGSSAVNSDTDGSTVTPAEYEQLSDRDMDTLHESLELLCEDYGQGEWECEYSAGVLTLTLPPHGTYVINKQPPNQQIWISSPLSGPGRFDYIKNDPNTKKSGWVHHRQSHVRLGELLNKELRELMERSGVGEGAEKWEGCGLE